MHARTHCNTDPDACLCATGGAAEVREAAADAIGELVAVTSEEALKPHIIAITGPLIRVISDKFQWQARAPCSLLLRLF